MNAFRGRNYEDEAEIKGRGIEEKNKRMGERNRIKQAN
jgi:hypothetical protein